MSLAEPAKLTKEPKIAHIGLNGEAILNVGARDGMEPCWLALYRKSAGRVFDPETGEDLGEYRPGPVIYLRVSDVREKFSVATAWTFPDICASSAFETPFQQTYTGVGDWISPAMPHGVTAGSL